MIKINICAFTGHRPSKLPGGYDWYNQHNILLGYAIRDEVRRLIDKSNIDTFISGGALGIDQMAFFIVEKLKLDYPYLVNIVAIPYKDQPKIWPKESQEKYEILLDSADATIYVDTLDNYKVDGVPVDIHHNQKLNKRNQYMVDHASHIIAVWDGSRGGTKNCIDYAKKKRRSISIIDPTRY